MVDLVVANILNSAPTIAAIVGTRIYPVEIATGSAMPALEYTFVGSESKATQDTYGSQRDRLEVNCWGSSYNDAVTLRAAVTAVLSQYSQGGVFISYIGFSNFFEPDLYQYRAMAEFYVFSNFTP